MNNNNKVWAMSFDSAVFSVCLTVLMILWLGKDTVIDIIHAVKNDKPCVQAVSE